MFDFSLFAAHSYRVSGDLEYLRRAAVVCGHAHVDTPHLAVAIRGDSIFLNRVADDHALGGKPLENGVESIAGGVGDVLGVQTTPHRTAPILDRAGIRTVTGKPRSDLGVELFDPVVDVFRDYAAVDEHIRSDDDNCVPSSEHARVGAAGSERGYASPLGCVEGKQQRIGLTHRHRVLKILKTSGSGVTQIEGRVQQLVIPVQNVDSASRTGGFFGEANEQIQDGLLSVTAVHLITRLHQNELAADPVILVIDRTGQLEGPAGGLEISVQVADGDNPGRVGKAGGRRNFGPG